MSASMGPGPVVNLHLVQELKLGDVRIDMSRLIENSGQYIEAHDNAKVGDVTQHISARDISDADVGALAEQLTRVWLAMKKAADPSNLDHDNEIANTGNAAEAAKSGDKKGVLQFLSSAGKWTLDVAKSVSADLVVALLKAQMGVPPS